MKYYAGIDLGGTFIKCGIVDETGKLLVKDKTPTKKERPYEAVAKDMANFALKLATQAGVKLSAAGIGSPGSIDSKNGVVVYNNNLKWDDVPLSDEVRAVLGVPVYVLNDANAAALGEQFCGAGNEYRDVIFVTLGTGVGGVVGAVLKRDSNKVVSLLLSFAAGIMLAVVCFDLMSEPIAKMESGDLPSYTPFIVVVAAIVGYGVVHLLNFIIDKRTNHEVKHIDKDHPQTADDLDELIHSNHLESHKDNHSNLFIAGLVMMSAIALHNLPEGMVIGASYSITPDLTANLFSGSGFIMAIVIGLHNIPEGMAVSVPLISGGMSKIKAILLTALSGLPTVFGALIGFAIGGINEIMLVLALGFASGAMLYVVFGELLPESILMWKSKLPALALFIVLLVGFLLVMF